MNPYPSRHVAGIAGMTPVQALLAATAALSLGVAVPVPPLRALIALPLALLVPGYALVLALFRRRAPLDTAPLLALVTLLSTAFYPLLALALHGIGLPLSSETVLAGTDVAVLVLAVLTRARAPSPSTIRPIVGTEAGQSAHTALVISPSTGPAAHSAAAGAAYRGGACAAPWGLGIALTIVCGGLGLIGATRALPTAPAAPYTAFYLSGRWSRLSSVVLVAPGHRLAVTIGVANNTGRRQTYRLSPLLDGDHWRAYSLTVAAGGAWAGTVSGRVPAGGCLRRLTLTLHRRGSVTPLRPLILWVHAGARMPRACAGREGRAR